jgi:hypothetical protein
LERRRTVQAFGADTDSKGEAAESLIDRSKKQDEKPGIVVGLGQLIYWFCCVVAVLLVLLALPGLMEPLRLPLSGPAEASTNYFQLGAAVMAGLWASLFATS